MFEARLVAMLLDMLMTTGDSGLIALRVVALGFSPIFGRLRVRMGEGGEGCLVVVNCCGGVGIGGLLSIEARGEISPPVEVAYVVTLKREGGCTYGSEGSM